MKNIIHLFITIEQSLLLLWYTKCFGSMYSRCADSERTFM